MLSNSPCSSPPNYTPFESSPLSSHHPNACPRFPTQMSSFIRVPNKGTSSWQRVSHQPFSQHIDGEQDRRRRAFLKKVKQNRDDRRWESRADQMLRREYISRQKQWEEYQARSAPVARVTLEDEEMEDELGLIQRQDAARVDMALSQENQEFDALISLMHEQEKNREDHEKFLIENRSDDEDYGSDGEESYRLLMQFTSEVEAEVGAKARDQTIEDAWIFARDPGQEMDISID